MSVQLTGVCHGGVLGTERARAEKRVRQSRRNTRSVTVCGSQIKDAGASGYAVEGLRPTSPKAWEIMSTVLKKKGIKFVTPSEVKSAQKRGTIVLDIRPRGEYNQARIPNSVNVEFYRLISGWDPLRVARRALFAFFGVLNGTEFNPEFFEEIETVVGDKRKDVIVCCNVGGTLEPTGPSEFGRQSRSLTAAYELLRVGYTKVRVLEGGVSQWVKSGETIESN